MLSQENRKRINKNGLYRHDVDVELLPAYRREHPFHCINWTFRPAFRGEQIIMCDTYYGDTFGIKVTNENIDEFKLIFDFTDVRKIKADEADIYETGDVILWQPIPWGGEGGT